MYWYKPETLAKHCQNGWDDSPLKARFDEFGIYIKLLNAEGQCVPEGPMLNIIGPAIEGQPN